MKNRDKLHQPTVEFLIAQRKTCQTDADLGAVIDGMADTIGDMLGFQTHAVNATERFVDRLVRAVELAMVQKRRRETRQ